MALLFLSVVFANLVWGLSPLLAKAGLEDVGEVSFLLIRFGLSTLFFLPLVVRSIRRLPQIPPKWLALGVGTVAIHYYLQVVALRQVPVTWYVFFYALCPVLNLFAVRAKLSARNITVGGLALIGSWLFVDFTHAQNISGMMVVTLVVSVLTWVLFTMTVKSWQSVYTDSEISAVTSALSFCIFGVFAVVRPSLLSTSGWTMQAGAFTVLLAILLPLAFLAYSYSLRKNPGVAVLGQYSEPIFGTLGAMLIFGETLSARQLSGMGITAAALVILLVPARSATAKRAETNPVLNQSA